MAVRTSPSTEEFYGTGAVCTSRGSGNEERDAGMPWKHGSRSRYLPRDARDVGARTLERNCPELAAGTGELRLRGRDGQGVEPRHDTAARRLRRRSLGNGA